MAARRSVIGPIVLMLVVFVALLAFQCTEATRALPEDFARENNHAMYSSAAYERARCTMACWFERLAWGPNPGSTGH
ncbi:hypothetical protein EUGRSUZ_H00332 [Eucalyptus grandis]|uniref:Uncharacterized protein n=2 Tax=Eucalyptus grandis TaxID=71139 RepID=A0ACC3JK44_EUCGR|nr:hypothetical protein EUGRSUZ_H00332 [Eucalyptus grandis]